jgi:hypothetical protein
MSIALWCIYLGEVAADDHLPPIAAALRCKTARGGCFEVGNVEKQGKPFNGLSSRICYTGNEPK